MSEEQIDCVVVDDGRLPWNVMKNSAVCYPWGRNPVLSKVWPSRLNRYGAKEQQSQKSQIIAKEARKLSDFICPEKEIEAEIKEALNSCILTNTEISDDLVNDYSLAKSLSTTLLEVKEKH